jgi:hypothetical protein
MTTSKKQYAERIPSLLDEEPITFYPNLAVVFGVNEAIVLQQIYFYMNVNRKKKSERHFLHDRWWVYNSYEQWCNEHFPWLSERGLQTIMLGLEKSGVVMTMQGVENPRDRRKWYSIDLDKLYAIVQNGAMHDTKNVSSHDTKNVPSNTHSLCHEYTESTTEKTIKEKESLSAADAADGGGWNIGGKIFATTASERLEDTSISHTHTHVQEAEQQDSKQSASKQRTNGKNATTPIPQKPAARPPSPMDTADPKEVRPRTAKQQARDEANDLLITSMGTAWGIPAVKADEKDYLMVAQKLVSNGVPDKEFKWYVQFQTREAAARGYVIDTIWGLVGKGRISKYVAARDRHAGQGGAQQTPPTLEYTQTTSKAYHEPFRGLPERPAMTQEEHEESREILRQGLEQMRQRKRAANE